jgi:hypothetical protein
MFICISVSGSVKAILAQSGCLCIENSFAQTPCARSGAKPTAQELIARREIQDRISNGADEAKDLDAATHFDTPDFTVKNLDGTVDTLQDARKGIQQNYDYIYAVSDESYNHIDCLTLKGKEAIVYINQHFVRTVPDRKDGSPHEVITNITHRETWVYTAQGWLRKHIDELQRGPTFLDGQPYNPE